MSLEIVLVGTVLRMSDVIHVTETFSKQSIVIQDQNDQYPNFFEIEFHKERTDLLSPIGIGAKVEVSINIRGREWTKPGTEDTKVFTTLVGWRIKEVQQSAVGAAKDTISEFNDSLKQKHTVDSSIPKNNDLPF